MNGWVLIVLGTVAGIVAGCFLVALFRLNRSTLPPLPPDRKVTKYGQNAMGELWDLECGHQVRIVMHKPIAIGCKQCQEAKYGE